MKRIIIEKRIISCFVLLIMSLGIGLIANAKENEDIAGTWLKDTVSFTEANYTETLLHATFDYLTLYKDGTFSLEDVVEGTYSLVHDGSALMLETQWHGQNYYEYTLIGDELYIYDDYGHILTLYREGTQDDEKQIYENHNITGNWEIQIDDNNKTMLVFSKNGFYYEESINTSGENETSMPIGSGKFRLLNNDTKIIFWRGDYKVPFEYRCKMDENELTIYEYDLAYVENGQYFEGQIDAEYQKIHEKKAETEDSLVGKWDLIEEQDEGSFVFGSDGTMELITNEYTVAGTYQTEEHLLKMIWDTAQGTGIDRFEYTVNGDYLTLYQDGNSITLVRDIASDEQSNLTNENVRMEYYILPESNSRFLTEADLEGLSLQELCYAKNEIYARLGRKFKSKELQEYFNAQSWYNGIYEPTESNDELIVSSMNQYELYNKDLLWEVEQRRGPYQVN